MRVQLWRAKKQRPSTGALAAFFCPLICVPGTHLLACWPSRHNSSLVRTCNVRQQLNSRLGVVSMVPRKRRGLLGVLVPIDDEDSEEESVPRPPLHLHCEAPAVASLSGRQVSVPELPQALLERILVLACRDGALPTAVYAPCVSHAMRRATAAALPQLWRVADLSYGWSRATDAVLARLSRLGAFAETETLNLGGCASLTDRSLEALASATQLKEVNLSGCRGFTAEALVRFLARPGLLRVSLARSALRQEHARRLFASAPDFEALSLAGCPRLNTAYLRTVLALHSLRELDLTSAGGVPSAVVVPLEALQQACPRMEVLKLSALGLDAGWSAPRSTAGLGFPFLRCLQLASGSRMTSAGSTATASCVDDDLLARFLRNARQLTQLALGGTRVTARGLERIEADGLCELYLQGSAAATDAGARVASSRWASTLQRADFAGASLSDLGVAELAACAHLRSLDVSMSAVTAAGVRLLLRLGLDELSLVACRSLDRAVRQAALAGLPQLRAALL